MKEIWFKQKSYGWGWTPSNWKGWLSLLSYVVLMGAYPIFCYFKKEEPNPIIFILITTFLTTAILTLAFVKGESPKWNWGKKTK